MAVVVREAVDGKVMVWLEMGAMTGARFRVSPGEVTVMVLVVLAVAP